MTTAARPHHTTATLLGIAVLTLLTQTGCATLFTATTCVAAGAKHCDGAIEAAAAIDGAVFEAAAEASTHATVHETSYEAGYGDGYQAGGSFEASDDSCHELVCYQGRCECADGDTR